MAHNMPSDGKAPEWIDDFVGAELSPNQVAAIDDDANFMNESKQKVTVIKESGETNRYIASSVDATDYVDEKYL